MGRLSLARDEERGEHQYLKYCLRVCPGSGGGEGAWEAERKSRGLAICKY